jgi:hypothetical protein
MSWKVQFLERVNLSIIVISASACQNDKLWISSHNFVGRIESQKDVSKRMMDNEGYIVCVGVLSGNAAKYTTQWHVISQQLEVAGFCLPMKFRS